MIGGMRSSSVCVCLWMQVSKINMRDLYLDRAQIM